MVNPQSCFTGLPPEMRQRIYDYIASEVGDRTIKVTLNRNDRQSPISPFIRFVLCILRKILSNENYRKYEYQNERLHFENGKSIFNLALTARIFRDELLSYLFKHITFVLTDSQRTCRPIVTAFVRAFLPETRALVQKIAIPFFTIRGLFDPAHFVKPLVLASRQQHQPGIMNGAHLNPYVLTRLAQGDDGYLYQTVRVLRKELKVALLLLNLKLTGLEHLKLGVDIIEFLAFSASVSFQPNELTSNLAAVIAQVGKAGLSADDSLLRALQTISGMPKLREVKLELDWDDFVEKSYARAGYFFTPPTWTRAVKEDLQRQFKDMIRDQRSSHSEPQVSPAQPNS